MCLEQCYTCNLFQTHRANHKNKFPMLLSLLAGESRFVKSNVLCHCNLGGFSGSNLKRLYYFAHFNKTFKELRVDENEFASY